MRAMRTSTAYWRAYDDRERLGAALALVVAGARADRVDVAPVGLGLRVFDRVAVHLGRRRDQDARLRLAREVEHVQRPLDRRADRAHRVALVVDRRRRTGQVEDLVDLHRQRIGDVVAHQLEAMVVEQRLDVGARAREEVVEAHDLVPIGEQPLAQMRAEKAGATRHQDASSLHSSFLHVRGHVCKTDGACNIGAPMLPRTHHRRAPCAALAALWPQRPRWPAAAFRSRRRACPRRSAPRSPRIRCGGSRPTTCSSTTRRAARSRRGGS